MISNEGIRTTELISTDARCLQRWLIAPWRKSDLVLGFITSRGTVQLGTIAGRRVRLW